MSTVGSRVVPEDELQGALFDIDGTVLDTMPLFYGNWPEWAKPHGFDVSVDEFYLFSGRPMKDIYAQMWLLKKGTPADPELIDQLHREYMVIHNRRKESGEMGQPAAIEATVAAARAYVEAGIPIAAATSGLRETVEEQLRGAGLEFLFPSELIICAADLPEGRGKPHPDIFLRAAELIGADPRKCIAYEDAEAGLEAAWKAGCQIVDVRDFKDYPFCDALKQSQIRERAARTWLDEKSCTPDQNISTDATTAAGA